MPGTGDIIWIVDRYSSIMAGRSEVPAPRILTNSTYYLQKDVVLDSWVSQIQSVFQRWKKSRHLTELLNKFFISAENPYYSALYLFVYSGDLKLAKTNTLAFTAMQDFQAWLRFSNQPSVSSQLNPELKMKAFTHVTGQRNIAVMKLVFEVFKMKESKELFVKDIHEMLDRKMYKEAAQITAMLDLQDFFTIEDFLVPLIFLDVVNVVEEYLDASSDTIRSNLIQFLDCMMINGSPESERNLIIERLNIPVSDVKFQKIQYKPLKKFMDKTIKKYNIDPSCCPNLVERKDRGALNFILKKRYHDNDIGHDGWREMVEDTVRSREGQMDLIRALTDMQDMKEALYWAQFYEIPFEEYPFYLQNYSKSKDLGEITDEDDNRLEIVRENKMQHYNMPLPKESIIMIDTIEKLETFIDCELNGSAKTIGLDAEWKPAFTKSVAVLSLMQIATIDRVFLIDMLILDKNSCVWENFGNQLFANQNILKLGFSFDGDIHMLRQSIRTFEKYKLSGLGFLDISLLWKTLSKDWSIKLPFEDLLAPKKTDASLSYLVQLCNGFPLDKKEQVSNWEKRPLRESQERYAATDAYCLIMIYNTLKECSLKQNIPFFDICEELMTKVTTKKPPIKKKHHQAKQQVEISKPPRPNIEPVSVGWMYAMCIGSLEGLGKKLRMLGIDTLIVGSKHTYEEYLQMAKSENRIVIVSGSLYSRFVRDLAPTFCYKCESTTLDEQILEVLDYYNITVKESDIFSRCMVCNCNEFAKIESQTMKEMLFDFIKEGSTPKPSSFEVSPPPPRPLADDEDDDDDYLDDSLYFIDDLIEEEEDFHPGPPIVKPQVYAPKPGEIIKLGTYKTVKGIDIQLEEIPMGIIDRVPLFYVCENCGKCYWDGTHLNRFLQSRSQQFIYRSSFKTKLNLSND